MNKIELKRGDTLSYVIDLTDADDTPLDIALVDIKSQIRYKSGELIDTLVIAKDPIIVGRYFVTSVDTSGYHVGELEMDIKIRDGDVVLSTETTYVTVKRDVTRWL